MSTQAMFVAAAICGISSLGAAAQVTTPAEIRLTGDWTVSVTVPGTPPVTAELKIPGPDIVTVAHEKYDRLPDFDAKTAAGWRKGVRLRGVIAAECTVEGLLDPESLVVRAGPEPAAATFRKGVDYEADLVSGTVGRLPQGAIAPDQPVYIDYRHARMRIDSAVLSADGRIVLKTGTPHTAMPEPPALAPGETRLANIFISGRLDALTDDNLFPILETAYPEPAQTGLSVAERLLPKSLKKLQSGEPLKILAWGDSVTTFNRYQTMFVERLKARYPNAKIELITEAWGGRNTGSYLSEPPGSEHNYQEKVLDRKPDLIVSEFVNDAGLSETQVEERYGKILADFRKIGAEWIILTPHYVRPSWMGLSSQRNIDDDPRAYVKGVRLFAQKNQVAVAEGSLRYGRLWRQGIPYITLMENNINHPNVYGHTLFADSLMALFPKSESPKLAATIERQQSRRVAVIELLTLLWHFDTTRSAHSALTAQAPQAEFAAPADPLQGFTAKLTADFKKFDGERSILEIPEVLSVRLRQHDPLDRERQNYPAFKMPDGSAPVLEANIRLHSPEHPDWKDMTIGIPLAMLKKPEGEHDIVLNFCGVRWAMYVDGELLDNDFPYGYPRWAARNTWKLNAEYVEQADLYLPAIKPTKKQAAAPRLAPVQYWTPPGHNSWVGDVATFFHQGRYHVFYLYDRRHHRSKFGNGAHYFEHLSTSDFKTWIEHEAATPLEAQWECIGTGTPFVFDGKFCIGYGLHTERIYPDEKTTLPAQLAYIKANGRTGTFNRSAPGAPIGATYSVSGDGVTNFKKTSRFFHPCRNPSVYRDPSGKMRMLANNRSKGMWESESVDGGWRCISPDFPPGGDCTFFFRWGRFDYIIGGFKNLWSKPARRARVGVRRHRRQRTRLLRRPECPRDHGNPGRTFPDGRLDSHPRLGRQSGHSGTTAVSRRQNRLEVDGRTHA